MITYDEKTAILLELIRYYLENNTSIYTVDVPRAKTIDFIATIKIAGKVFTDTKHVTYVEIENSYQDIESLTTDKLISDMSNRLFEILKLDFLGDGK